MLVGLARPLMIVVESEEVDHVTNALKLKTKSEKSFPSWDVYKVHHVSMVPETDLSFLRSCWLGISRKAGRFIGLLLSG